MKDILRKPLTGEEFARIKEFRKAINAKSVYVKLDVIEGEEEEDEKLSELKQIYFSFFGLRPKEFFSLNENRALVLVNEKLAEQDMYPMETQEAISIMEADQEFRQLISDHLNAKLSGYLDEMIKKRTLKLIGDKAFSPDDYEIDYEEYERRMNTLQKYGRYYYREDK